MKKNDLIFVCELLNHEKVKYAIVGGWAVILHGHLRTTYDIDILIEKTEGNVAKLIKALKKLPWKIVKEIPAKEILLNPFTIVGDQPRVDIITLAGKIDYNSIKNKILSRKIDGVIVKYVDIDTLLKMKRTGRMSDMDDIEKLKFIKKNIINKP